MIAKAILIPLTNLVLFGSHGVVEQLLVLEAGGVLAGHAARVVVRVAGVENALHTEYHFN